MPGPCCKRSRCGTTFQCINGEMENGYCSQHVLGYLFPMLFHGLSNTPPIVTSIVMLFHGFRSVGKLDRTLAQFRI